MSLTRSWLAQVMPRAGERCSSQGLQHGGQPLLLWRHSVPVLCSVPGGASTYPGGPSAARCSSTASVTWKSPVGSAVVAEGFGKFPCQPRKAHRPHPCHHPPPGALPALLP